MDRTSLDILWVSGLSNRLHDLQQWGELEEEEILFAQISALRVGLLTMSETTDFRICNSLHRDPHSRTILNMFPAYIGSFRFMGMVCHF
jgi:hypothetical protein